MLQKYASSGKEHYLLSLTYVDNGGIESRNRINKIIDVEFEHFKSELFELGNKEPEGSHRKEVATNIIEHTNTLIAIGTRIRNILITNKDFEDPRKVKLAKDLVLNELTDAQESLNNGLDDLSYDYRQEYEAYQQSLAQELDLVFNSILYLGIFGAFLGIILSVYVTRSVTTPVLELIESAQKLGKGNFNVTVQHKNLKEINSLTTSFNSMASDLKSSFTKLTETTEDLEKERLKFFNESEKFMLALDSSSMGFWDFNIKTGDLKWDDQMFGLYGVKKENFAGAYEAWSNGLHPEDKARSEQELNAAIEGTKEFDTSFRVIHPNGAVRHIRATGKVLKDETGTPDRMIGLNWDVTKEYESAKAINEYSQLLEARNKQLNEFAYIASHDLQEPINTMGAFSDLLIKQYADKLDETGLEYLKFMRDSGTRAKELIADLLEYNRIGNDKHLAQLDLNEVAQAVLADLNARIESENAVIEIDHLPTLRGYETELRQLLQNLISNALKFKSEGTIPTIRISTIELGDAYQISVTDNGIGIDAKFSDKIFAVFSRLHSKSEFPGTGIGLANCKKCAEIHDGSIWVESELGKGSTFHFTISKKL